MEVSETGSISESRIEQAAKPYFPIEVTEVFGKVMSVSFMQPAKEAYPTVTPSDVGSKITFSRFWQFTNANGPIAEICAGMVMEVSPLQLVKEYIDIESSEAGSVMSDNELHDTKANLPIEVIVSESETDFSAIFPANVYSPIWLSPGKKVTEIRLSQETKAYLPRKDTESGITMDFNEQQPAKAKSPMVSTDDGIISESRFKQPDMANEPIFFSEAGSATEVKFELNEFVPIESPSIRAAFRLMPLKTYSPLRIVLRSIWLIFPVTVRLVTVFRSSMVSNEFNVPGVST